MPRATRDAPLSELTTLRLGGAARRMVDATDDDEVVEAVRAADAAGEPLLVLAGGSNVVVADEGFPGTVVRVLTQGVEERGAGDRTHLTVAAGEEWDELVARCVASGLAGVECLAGIPGSVGATPIQNVGAYGQEVAETIASVRAYDRHEGEVVELAPGDCGFAYRSSRFKRAERGRFVILTVAFELRRSPVSGPLRYGELARAVGASDRDRDGAAIDQVREAVLALRRAKGMVVDPADPDSVSAGSFFTNPVLPAEEFAELRRRAQGRLGDGGQPPAWPQDGGAVKTSAAWLIERAGFHRGYGDGPIGLSRKHTLAIVNRGGGTAAQLVDLARELRDGVRDAFGVTLEPEPVLVGLEL